MKYSESWLREWVNPNLSLQQFCNALTMAGLEVEETQPAAPRFNKVIIGEVIELSPHPQTELKVCLVDIGDQKKLQIVCGAPNINLHMKTAVALPQATLPRQLKIDANEIKGIRSEGMLCSVKELGLSEEGDTLLELPADAQKGTLLWDFLSLTDSVIDVTITPNRGDCLSVKGLAREVAAITQTKLIESNIKPIMPSIEAKLQITNKYPEGAPCYIGRIIKNVKADSITPVWMKERLRRSGIRSISPIVDITNYVMIELGQPMHAFDLSKIQKSIQIRLSVPEEEIVVLDGSTLVLDNETMVIADAEKPLAVAGVMGGLDSSVTLLTEEIFLESACFAPFVIAKQRQAYNIDSESAYRFERGVDPTIQEMAIERATELILQICGGKAGPMVSSKGAQNFLNLRIISLAYAKVTKVLGIVISEKDIESILFHLNFGLKKITYANEVTWEVTVPSYRSDITVTEDLIEEIARLHGYDKIPIHELKADLFADGDTLLQEEDFRGIRHQLSNLGYHEIISYSFIEKAIQKTLDPQNLPEELINPITNELAVMRTSLWPGLINTLKYNQSRQQHRARLFEIGTCFIKTASALVQLPRIAGLITGYERPEQWGLNKRIVDFYDLKGDIEAFLRESFETASLIYRVSSNAVLHPKQSAVIIFQDQSIGCFGKLHPLVAASLDISTDIFLFEFDLNLLKSGGHRRFEEISRFPEIRRDLALVVNEAIPAKDIQDTIRLSAGDWLKDIFIFDVYQGKGISPGHKSIALAVILQHPERTLIDDEVAESMERVVTALRQQLGAELRS